MPRPPRPDLPGVPQHVVQRGNDRQACFFQPNDYLTYLTLLYEASQRHGCAVHAYVLMTNHVHLLESSSTRSVLAWWGQQRNTDGRVTTATRLASRIGWFGHTRSIWRWARVAQRRTSRNKPCLTKTWAMSDLWRYAATFNSRRFSAVRGFRHKSRRYWHARSRFGLPTDRDVH